MPHFVPRLHYSLPCFRKFSFIHLSPFNYSANRRGATENVLPPSGCNSNSTARTILGAYHSASLSPGIGGFNRCHSSNSGGTPPIGTCSKDIRTVSLPSRSSATRTPSGLLTVSLSCLMVRGTTYSTRNPYTSLSGAGPTSFICVTRHGSQMPWDIGSTPSLSTKPHQEQISLNPTIPEVYCVHSRASRVWWVRFS